ncbi:MAG: pyruvate kinase [Acidimicrobiales bacterium]
MRRTKIVATIGPASDRPEILKSMIMSGMDVARIGLAHGTLDEHLAKYARIRAAAEACDANIGILADLPGPKVRCSPFPEGGVVFEDGAPVRFTSGDPTSSLEVISSDYDGLVRDVEVGDQLALGDGNITFVVEDKDADSLRARVIRGSKVQGRPGLQVPSDRLRISTPTPEDLRLADAFIEHGVDMLAISFVRSAHDVRSLGVEPAPRGPMVVAKIETRAAVENLEGIITASGAVMVARGDLGVDYALSELPHLQKHIIQRCIARGLPVITATQMLESMVYAPSPTRAEASDVANAVFDGTSSVMLSGETAIGIDPVNAVATMAEITSRADAEFPHDDWIDSVNAVRESDGDLAPGALTTDAITMAAVRVAQQVDAHAILCLSRTGYTVRSVSRYRPEVPILGFSPDARAAHQLSLSWGATAFQTPERTAARDMINDALDRTREHTNLHPGDRVVVISGNSTATRATDTLRVMYL